MTCILDTNINHSFWPSLDAARDAAALQAANTGAIVATVESVEIKPRHITFVATVPEAALDVRSDLGRRQAPKSFHTTWGALMHPEAVLGYMVVAPPLNCRGFDADRRDVSRIAITVARTFATIPPTNLGAVRCCECRRPIPLARLQALPGARLCTNCQHQKESIAHANH